LPEQIDNHYKQLINKVLKISTEEEFQTLKDLKMTLINEQIHDKLMKLPEILNFLNEVMRRHTPIPIQSRTAIQEMNIDYILDGKSEQLIIPKNTTMFLATFQSNNDEKYWSEPLKFDPSRFNDAEVRKGFNPFSVGKNQCMGRFQAISTLVSIMYHTIMNYKILPPIDKDNNIVDQQLEIADSFTHKFTEDLWVRLEPRDVNQ